VDHDRSSLGTDIQGHSCRSKKRVKSSKPPFEVWMGKRAAVRFHCDVISCDRRAQWGEATCDAACGHPGSRRGQRWLKRGQSVVGPSSAAVFLVFFSHLLANVKRSYATADGPRDTLSVKILSTVETSCTTNPQQIEVIDSKNYSWPTSSTQRRLVDCGIGVVNKLDRRSTCHGESLEFGTKGSTIIFWRYPNFITTQCGIGGRKQASM